MLISIIVIILILLCTILPREHRHKVKALIIKLIRIIKPKKKKKDL